MKEINFYNAIISNGIGVNLKNFNRDILEKKMCKKFESLNFECVKKSGKISLSKDKRIITDIVFDKYGVYFSYGTVSEMIEPIKIISLFLAENTFN